MNKIIIRGSVAALTALVAPAAMAASIVIDDFSGTGQAVSVATASGDAGVGQTVLDGTVLGGSRGLAIITDPSRDNTNTPDDVGDASVEVDPSVNNGVLTFNNGSNQTSTGIIVYNGAGASTTEPFILDADNNGIGDFVIDITDPFTAPTGADFGIDTFDLATDLTGGGVLDKFFFEVVDADVNVNIGIYVFDALGATIASYGEDLLAGFSPFAAFEDFTFSAGRTVADFTTVGAIAFAFQNNVLASANGPIPQPVDGQIGSISVVPLPASALLLLGGLGGFAGLSAAANRRRRKEV